MSPTALLAGSGGGSTPSLVATELFRVSRSISLPRAQATAFSGLRARAFDAGQPGSWLRDHAARKLARRLEVDHGTIDPERVGTVLQRAAQVDRWVRGFLSRSPGGTVIDLGTGLDTRFERIDNGVARWIDVDLPEIIDLRRRCLRSSSRREHVAASVVDPTWLARVTRPTEPCCVILQAVLGYLPLAEVRGMLARIASRLPDAMLVLDPPRYWRGSRGQLVDSRATSRVVDDDVAETIAAWNIGWTVAEVATLEGTAARAPSQLARFTT